MIGYRVHMNQPRLYRLSLWNRVFLFLWLIMAGIILVGCVAGVLLFWWPAMLIGLLGIALLGTMVAVVAKQLAHSAARVTLNAKRHRHRLHAGTI
jgi:hypothetical protein